MQRWWFVGEFFAAMILLYFVLTFQGTVFVASYGFESWTLLQWLSPPAAASVVLLALSLRHAWARRMYGGVICVTGLVLLVVIARGLGPALGGLSLFYHLAACAFFFVAGARMAVLPDQARGADRNGDDDAGADASG